MSPGVGERLEWKQLEVETAVKEISPWSLQKHREKTSEEHLKQRVPSLAPSLPLRLTTGAIQNEE